jgi:hypothetical protein
MRGCGNVCSLRYGHGLARFGADQDPATVLNPEAVAEVTALLKAVSNPAADIEVAIAAGWLRWHRYLVLQVGDDQEELAAVRALFAPVYQAVPDAVPAEIRAFFDQNKPPSPEGLDGTRASSPSGRHALSPGQGAGWPTRRFTWPRRSNSPATGM